jgi:hypothetical protein
MIYSPCPFGFANLLALCAGKPPSKEVSEIDLSERLPQVREVKADRMNPLWKFANCLSPLTATDGIRGREQQLIVSFRVVAIVAGFAQVWAFRHGINDINGIPYLEMGEAYMRGDWGTAINGMWGPFYSWVLGAPMRIFQPSPAHEYLVIELINLVVFLIAICSFEFFLRELLQIQHISRDTPARQGRVRLPPVALLLLGYPLFIWSSLFWITIWMQTPDMCVAVFVYVAAGILLRVERGAASCFSFAVLGVVLGFGYLAKAAMFPLAFTFLFASLSLGRSWRRALPSVFTAFVCFVVTAGPMIYSLSALKGRFTFGETGRINYIWHVNGNDCSWPHFPHWQKGIGSGAPLHPARRIIESPAVYEFPASAKGTYPMWYDPSFYWEGVSPRWDVRQQIATLRRSASEYGKIFLRGPQCVMIAGFLLFWLISRSGWSVIREVAGQWRLLLPAVAAFGIYALLLVQSRYIGPFGVLFWLGLLSGLRLPSGFNCQRRMWCTTLGVTVTMLTGTVIWTIHHTVREEFSTFEVVQLQYANHLKHLGLQPGEKVAIIGSAPDAVRWARLARVQIAAEMPWTEMEKFWQADDATKRRIVETFASTGIKAIVAEKSPLALAGTEWHRIGTTNDYAYVLADY